MFKSQKPQLLELRSLNCGNITMSKSQIGSLALNRRKWHEMAPEWSPGPEIRSPGFPKLPKTGPEAQIGPFPAPDGGAPVQNGHGHVVYLLPQSALVELEPCGTADIRLPQQQTLSHLNGRHLSCISCQLFYSIT